MPDILVHYLHYLGFALLLAALAVELALHRSTVDGTTARRLARIDALYGTAVLLMLATGLLKVFYYGKPPSYYGHNFVFHIKLTVFLLVVLLSLVPARQFFRARRTPPHGQATYGRLVRPILWVELGLLLLLPLLGVMMARGFGYTG
jgi:putative membrane protein